MVSMHQAFCFHYLSTHAYHLTRITPILNATLELMTVNGGVAEVLIRIARGVSRQARYATAESVIPILRWCCLPHVGVAELRLKLIPSSLSVPLQPISFADTVHGCWRRTTNFSAEGNQAQPGPLWSRLLYREESAIYAMLCPYVVVGLHGFNKGLCPG
jgi:hypothetical protein